MRSKNIAVGDLEVEVEKLEQRFAKSSELSQYEQNKLGAFLSRVEETRKWVKDLVAGREGRVVDCAESVGIALEAFEKEYCVDSVLGEARRLLKKKQEELSKLESDLDDARRKQQKQKLSISENVAVTEKDEDEISFF